MNSRVFFVPLAMLFLFSTDFCLKKKENVFKNIDNMYWIKIKVGMMNFEVKKVLGEPLIKKKESDIENGVVEVWKYNFSNQRHFFEDDLYTVDFNKKGQVDSIWKPRMKSGRIDVEKWSRLKRGMTKKETLDMIGAPIGVTKAKFDFVRYGTEIWIFDWVLDDWTKNEEKSYVVCFDNNEELSYYSIQPLIIQ
jgi:outer membrane protein assembly factor BamE (lipoprotein component of BamABCDE complex)